MVSSTDGLADHDRLKAALQRRVFFDVLAKLVERGGADALQFASRQCRLDDVARVNCALGGARADEGVQFVDEENDLAASATDFIHDALHALLELAAIFGARDEAGKVECDDAFVAQRLGHIATDNALRQTLCNGGLADAGLADECRDCSSFAARGSG